MSQNTSSAETDPPSRETISQEQIEVHWQHPRHELERPVLLVWPNPLRENWAAEVLDDNTATVVCREVLYREDTDDEADGRGEIQKRSEPVQPHDEIPQYVETALLDYDSEYGPIDSVMNPVNTTDETPPTDPQVTLEDYFDRETSVAAAIEASATDGTDAEEDAPVENLLCGGRQANAIRRNP